MGENKQWPSHSEIDPMTKEFIWKLRENNVPIGRVCSILGVHGNNVPIGTEDKKKVKGRNKPEPRAGHGSSACGGGRRGPGAGRQGLARGGGRRGPGAGRRGSARGGGRRGPGAGVGGHGTGGGNPRQPDGVGGRRQRPDDDSRALPSYLY